MDPVKLNEIINIVEGTVDLWEVKDEWAKLKEMARWEEDQKNYLGKAIETYSEKWRRDNEYGSIAEGLALAAYIQCWDDLLERYQEKDACMRYSELGFWLKEKEGYATRS